MYEVLSCDLLVAGFSNKRIHIVKKKDMLSSTTNHQNFKYHFVVGHVVVAQIWEYLQTTGVSAENITIKNPKPKKYDQGD